MKKFFTLIAAALMAVGASAQTAITYGGQGDAGGWSWGYTQTFDNGSFALKSTSGYGRFDICKGTTPTAGQKLVVDVASITGEHQISWKEDGEEKYSGTLLVGENTITFAGTTISDVNLLGPGTVGDNDAIAVNSVKLDGVQTNYETKWNYGVLSSKITQVDGTTIKQWAEMKLNKVTGRTDLWLVINANEDIPEYYGEGEDNALKHGFQLKIIYTDGTEAYPGIQGGEGVKSVKIDCGANVSEISIQALNGGAVATAESLNIASIEAYDGEPAGIEAVEAAPAAQKVIKTSKGIIKNGVKYNFAGQLVK